MSVCNEREMVIGRERESVVGYRGSDSARGVSYGSAARIVCRSLGAPARGSVSLSLSLSLSAYPLLRQYTVLCSPLARTYLRTVSRSLARSLHPARAAHSSDIALGGLKKSLPLASSGVPPPPPPPPPSLCHPAVGIPTSSLRASPSLPPHSPHAAPPPLSSSAPRRAFFANTAREEESCERFFLYFATRDATTGCNAAANSSVRATRGSFFTPSIFCFFAREKEREIQRTRADAF